ncbi:hypothetical protein VOLCADRAFT_89479 [Volvox carteri f. nagariensis]|uniref:Mitochondrial carrier protein n=1 Tax=Volvox carteri f. nagariensis TaxID=3068 RepID=D8TRY1_VOLCA|nr:uncharacterized protein VOLCADRAFT_89479 [Volvox carteri f. nagariensis]EFJ49599.1 hypothetical protein VOLCADRAFT_89479 [Volvox carteri f. nagariensis]|eukprot:XP_002949106.1 hypothetical protein VOLCADRAFT_89479 [Volvox carteri f. nagariensis]
MSNFLKGMSMPLPRRAQLARVAVAASVAVGAGVVLHTARRSGHTRVAPQQMQSRFYLPQPAVDAICGAVGEVCQIVILYPLETIKVRCQADGISASAVLTNMTRDGWGPRFMQQLYSGIGSATAFSVVVGAIHWLTFCAAKRAALDVMVQQERQQQSSDAAAAAGGAANLVHVQHTASGDKAHVHFSSGHHMHDEEVALQEGISGAGVSGPGGGCTADGSDVGMLASANMVGATVGAIATALVEGPLELFRHQAQAGLISGNLFREMANVVRTRGPMGLYWGFLPYCLESFPYDISELATYSQLRDVYNQFTRAEGTASPLFGAASKVPSQVWDIAIGAAAGSAATLISMPFDVVKTYMQTHAADAISLNAAGQVGAFFKTGVWMVTHRGLGALWVGLVPRLAQQVPSCTICWWAVEACQHFLKPITEPAPARTPAVRGAMSARRLGARCEF